MRRLWTMAREVRPGRTLPSNLNLRQAIVTGVALGVLLPALLLGGLLVRDRYETVRRACCATAEPVRGDSLQRPRTAVVERRSGSRTADRLGTEQSRRSIHPRRGRFLGRFVDVEAPERRAGKSVVAKREIRREGKVLGYLTVELATGRIEGLLTSEAVKLGVTLLCS